MKSILVALSLLSFASGAEDLPHAKFHHLTFTKSGVHAHCLWTQGPNQTDESHLQIEFKDPVKHQTIEAPGKVSVNYGMPSMPEMTNPGPVELNPILGANGQPLLGSYLASNIWFTMGGDWLVQVTVKSPDGTTETQSFDQSLD